MPRYFFDLYAGNVSDWDDQGLEATGIEDAIARAKAMLTAAIAGDGRLQGDRHAVVMVRDRVGNHSATVTGTGGGEARVIRAARSASG